MIKACLFDLDGTLLDTLPSITDRLNETLALFSYNPISRERARAFVGDGARMLVSRALTYQSDTVCEDEIDTVTKAYVKRYNDDYERGTVPYAGTVELVSALKCKGYALAVISNKPDATVKQLCDRFFGGQFDIVLGARDGVALKPAPDAPLDICKELGVLPENTAYLGDTGVDMLTARAYGAGVSIGVLWGFRESDELVRCGADVLITEPMDALRHIEK